MGRVSNRRQRLPQIPQRVSGPKPGERQAATVLVELQLAERNHLFRAAGRGAYSQPLLGPSQADRYTLRSCSVEDGYSSVQEPEPGVPRQISLLRQCFVPPECTRYSVPSTEPTPPLYPVYPLLYPPPAPSPAPKQSSFPDHPPTRGSVTSSSNNLHWFQNIEEVGLTADDDPDEHNKVPM